MQFGAQTFQYTGSFGYDYYGNVYGTLSGYTEYYGNAIVLKAKDFSVDASLAQTAINTGNADALMAYIGRGADTVFGSNFSDKIAGFSGNDWLQGFGGSDQIYGDDGADWIYGGSGNDTLYGGSGDDYLNGGTGADYLIGGSGVDQARYSTATSKVTADLQYANYNAGEAKGDSYSSIENLVGSKFSDSLRGNGSANKIEGRDGNDWLYGRGGNDKLYGGSGDDKLYGGSGNDMLTGDSGEDTFVFRENDNKDRITDFENNRDTIQLDDALWNVSLSVSQVINNFASVKNGDIVFDFGSDELVIEDFTSLNALKNDIDIF